MAKEIVRAIAYNGDGTGESRLFEKTADNIASFIVKNMFSRCVIADLGDNLIVNSVVGGFIDRCPDQEYLINELHPAIIPMQMGDREPVEIEYIEDDNLMTETEKAESIIQDFIEEYDLNHGNGEFNVFLTDEDLLDVYIHVEAPNHWTNTLVFETSLEDLLHDIKMEFIGMVETLDYAEYFAEIWSREFAEHNGFTAMEFLEMLMDDFEFYDKLKKEFQTT